jgi:hypothetical protein
MAHREEDCKRCGRCCRARLGTEGEVFVFPWYRCPHLDLDTKLCRIYPDRFHRKGGKCLTVEEGIPDRAYPRDCPYVRGLVGYRPPIEVPNEEAVQRYLRWW